MEKTTRNVKETWVSKDDSARADRLAAALRANLHRRKAQARAQDVPAEPDEQPQRERPVR